MLRGELNLKSLKIGMLFTLCFLLTGCWDRNELSQVMIVTGIAIDTGEEYKFRMSIESIIATEINVRTARGNSPTLVHSVEGDTISELTHKFNVEAMQHHILSHMRLLVISEEVGKQGILSFLDFFDRDREIRDDFNIIISKGSKAEDVLKITNAYKKSASLSVFPQLDIMHEEWGGTPDIKLNDFIRIYTSKGQAPVLSAMSIKGDIEKGNTVENMKYMVPKAIIKLDSLAAFKGGKLIGYLSLEEVRLLLWVQNKMDKTSISIPCEKKDKYFSVRIQHSKTSVKVKEENETPTFNIKVDMEGALEESGCYEDFSIAGSFEKLEKLAEEKLKEDLENLITKMKDEYRADIFGFGEILRKEEYKSFKKYHNDWTEGFKRSIINIDFNLEIKRSGLRKNSFKTS